MNSNYTAAHKLLNFLESQLSEIALSEAGSPAMDPSLSDFLCGVRSQHRFAVENSAEPNHASEFDSERVDAPIQVEQIDELELNPQSWLEKVLKPWQTKEIGQSNRQSALYVFQLPRSKLTRFQLSQSWTAQIRPLNSPIAFAPIVTEFGTTLECSWPPLALPNPFVITLYARNVQNTSRQKLVEFSDNGDFLLYSAQRFQPFFNRTGLLIGWELELPALSGHTVLEWTSAGAHESSNQSRQPVTVFIKTRTGFASSTAWRNLAQSSNREYVVETVVPRSTHLIEISKHRDIDLEVSSCDVFDSQLEKWRDIKIDNLNSTKLIQIRSETENQFQLNASKLRFFLASSDSRPLTNRDLSIIFVKDERQQRDGHQPGWRETPKIEQFGPWISALKTSETFNIINLSPRFMLRAELQNWHLGQPDEPRLKCALTLLFPEIETVAFCPSAKSELILTPANNRDISALKKQHIINKIKQLAPLPFNNSLRWR